MKKNTKIFLIVGGLVAIYLYMNKKPKTISTKQVPQGDSNDSMRTTYNVVPLPDIKGVKYTSVRPLTTIGATSSSPIIIATK